MFIEKVKIHNFKCYKDFELYLDKNMNIVVGDNEAGKTTIIEAINLALTGFIHGRSIRNEISQYLFNTEAVDEYINSTSGIYSDLPYISIEVFFGESSHNAMNGNGNSDNDNNAVGFVFKIAFDEKYKDEYELLVQNSEIKSLPIEYYDAMWVNFARDTITTKSIRFKSSLIDSSEFKYYGGDDIYLARIIKDSLETNDIVSVSQTHRRMKDSFASDRVITKINEKINKKSSLTGKKISLSVDMSTKNSWESSFVTRLDDIPFGYIGKGEQCVVKTELALSKQSPNDVGIILIEEPENHLSHTNMNNLIKRISECYGDKQIVITTHSSFVANKLKLCNVALMKKQTITKMSSLPKETYSFF